MLSYTCAGTFECTRRNRPQTPTSPSQVLSLQRMGGRSAGPDAFQVRRGSSSGARRLLGQAHTGRYVIDGTCTVRVARTVSLVSLQVGQTPPGVFGVGLSR